MQTSVKHLKNISVSIIFIMSCGSSCNQNQKSAFKIACLFHVQFCDKAEVDTSPSKRISHKLITMHSNLNGMKHRALWCGGKMANVVFCSLHSSWMNVKCLQHLDRFFSDLLYQLRFFENRLMASRVHEIRATGSNSNTKNKK